MKKGYDKLPFDFIIKQIIDGYYTICFRRGNVWTHGELKVDVDKKTMDTIIKKVNFLLNYP